MLNRFKSALFTVVGGFDTLGKDNEGVGENRMPLKFPYSRPSFLQFATEEEMMVSVDHSIRPIIVPRSLVNIPWRSGYAEAINAGKSEWNEDQACIQVGNIRKPQTERNEGQVSSGEDLSSSLPYVYFAMFDGHAGYGAAVAACKTLHKIIEERLTSVMDLLLEPESACETKQNTISNCWFPEKHISKDSLIVGALEAAFWDMDILIEQDRQKYHMTGGCTALVALFIMGKLYVANAGDSRAVISKGEKALPMSQDFTPESERQRIRGLALARPDLLGGEYTAKEFCRRVTRKDIGKQVLCRNETMIGWSYKTVSSDDIKFPLVYGEGKRSRVLATIGVTRGFGDHDLRAQNSNVNIKPFLTPQPEVTVFDVADEDLTENDVLIMGTDGLWDITSSDKAAEIVRVTLNHFSCKEDPRYLYRYVSTAQDLVMHSRGKLRDRCWRTASGSPATIDDITVFVIPLLPYKEDFQQWQLAKSFVSNMCQDNSQLPVADGDDAMES